MVLRVVLPIRHEGETLLPWERLELPDEDAERLLKASPGILEVATLPPPSEIRNMRKKRKRMEVRG